MIVGAIVILMYEYVCLFLTSMICCPFKFRLLDLIPCVSCLAFHLETTSPSL